MKRYSPFSEAEQAAVDEAVARLLADAPPVPEIVVEMLRKDRCPIIGRKSRGEAA